MATFIAQAESYLADLEAHIAKLEDESAQTDAEIRRLLNRAAIETPELKREATYIMIKPDGVQRGLIGEIIERFEQKGFKLVGCAIDRALAAGTHARATHAVTPGSSW